MTGTSITLADYAGDPFEYALDVATGAFVRHRVDRKNFFRPEMSGFASVE